MTTAAKKKPKPKKKPAKAPAREPKERTGKMGRPPGIPNFRTAEVRDAYIKSGKITPLEFLLNIMNEEPRPKLDGEDEGAYLNYKFNQMERRIDCAKSAAPYMHPKLAQTELKGNLNISHEDALRELE